MRIVALRNSLEEMRSVRAVLGPFEDGLVVLLDTSVERADRNAEPLRSRIEALAGKRIPGAADDIGPIGVVFRERKLVFDLKVELRFSTVGANALQNKVVERIAERSALA
jgi:hypothetical protein